MIYLLLFNVLNTIKKEEKINKKKNLKSLNMFQKIFYYTLFCLINKYNKKLY